MKTLDCTIEEYHARPEWSCSQVKLLPHDPITFNRRHITKESPLIQTASMKLGTALHRVLLDEDALMEIPAEMLSASGAKVGGAWKKFSAAHADKVLVKSDDPLLHMVASVRNEPAAMKLLNQPGPIEQTLVYTDAETGLDLRARPDKISIFRDGAIIVDVKSTANPLPGDHAFGKEIAKFDYHRQAAWYWDGAELARELLDLPDIKAFVMIAVRNKEPFECVVHELDYGDIELGRQENRAGLVALRDRLERNDWNLATRGRIIDTRLPKWRYKKEMEE